MSKSKVSIPRRGINPAALEAALSQKNRAMVDAMTALDGVMKMVTENCRMIGQLVVMFEVLKDKGIITHAEINSKFQELEAKRKAAEEAKEADAKAEWNAERQALADNSNGRNQEGTDSPQEEVKVPIISEISVKAGSLQSTQGGNDEGNQ